jgi:hypothetical protein
MPEISTPTVTLPEFHPTVALVTIQRQSVDSLSSANGAVNVRRVRILCDEGEAGERGRTALPDPGPLVL